MPRPSERERESANKTLSNVLAGWRNCLIFFFEQTEKLKMASQFGLGRAFRDRGHQTNDLLPRAKQPCYATARTCAQNIMIRHVAWACLYILCSMFDLRFLAIVACYLLH